MPEDIVILSGARTAIGTFGGALAAMPPIELGTAEKRHSPSNIDDTENIQK